MNHPQTLWIVIVLLLIHCFDSRQQSTKSIYSTNEIWSTPTQSVIYKRPKWAKEVRIIYGNLQIWSVEGIVVPLSTKGRNDAPKPYNGYTIGNDVKLDKGHVMALSNGGPDVNYNIVPQSSQWQRTDGWRKLEKVIFDYAVSKYRWDPANIHHASEVEHVRSPGARNLVTYNVTMSSYNRKSGEPMKYTGFVQSGENNVYSFTITPGKEAAWSHNRAPQSEFKSQYNTNEASDSAVTVAIVLIIGLFILCLLMTVLVYKRMKRRRIEEIDTVNDNYQHI